MAHMQRPEVQRREQAWRAHVEGSDVQPMCDTCRTAASWRQACQTGLALFDEWVRAAQIAYRDMYGGA